MQDNQEPIRVFLSSRQGEFSSERRALIDLIKPLPLLAVVAAEEWSAQRMDPATRYTVDAQRCPIYLGLFGKEYSQPTEQEYRAAAKHPDRELMLYIRRVDAPDERLAALLAEMKSTHVVSHFATAAELVNRVGQDLWAGVSRMVNRYMEIAEGPPLSRGGERSPQARRYQAGLTALMSAGWPGLASPSAAGQWAAQLREMMREAASR